MRQLHAATQPHAARTLPSASLLAPALPSSIPPARTRPMPSTFLAEGVSATGYA